MIMRKKMKRKWQINGEIYYMIKTPNTCMPNNDK